MKINKYLILMTAVLVCSVACSQSEANKNTANNQTAANNTNVTINTNQYVNNANANQTVTNKTETDKTTVGSLATPTAAYKAAYAARQKKDIEALKKVFSKDAIEFFTTMSKEEGKTLDESLKELVEIPQNPSDESRNEKINGDKATLEYLSEKGTWMPMDFVKEGNDWKLTVPKADSKDDKTKEEK